MSYTPTVWTDFNAPDLEAANLNHIEGGIADAHDLADALDTRVTTIESAGNGVPVYTSIPAGPYVEGQQLRIRAQGPVPSSAPFSYESIGLVYDDTIGHFVAPGQKVYRLIGQTQLASASNSNSHEAYSLSTAVARVRLPFRALDAAGLTYMVRVMGEMHSSDSNGVSLFAYGWTGDNGGSFANGVNIASSPSVGGTSFKLHDTGWKIVTGMTLGDYIAFSFGWKSGNGVATATVQNVDILIREASK